MVISRKQEYWSGLPFLSPVDHILSEFSTMTILGGPTWHGSWFHGVRQGCDQTRSVWSVWLVFCDCGFHSVCPLRGLWKLPDGRDWLWGKLGLVLMGRAMLSKSLIQVFADVWACVPSLLFDLKPNYGGVTEDNGDLLHKDLYCLSDNRDQSCIRKV